MEDSANLLLRETNQPFVEAVSQLSQPLLSARVKRERGSQLVQVVDQEDCAILD